MIYIKLSGKRKGVNLNMIRHSNIILIGMRGSGKTTVGRLIAKLLVRSFIELDEDLEKAVGMKIARFVSYSGWDAFRDKESHLVKKLKGKENCIISTGGGVILREENVKILQSLGTIIWLKVDIETLIKRIGEDPKRPSLTGKPLREDMKVTFRQRRELYAKAADYSIDTVGKPTGLLAQEIIGFISEAQGLPLSVIHDQRKN